MYTLLYNVCMSVFLSVLSCVCVYMCDVVKVVEHPFSSGNNPGSCVI